MRYEEIFYANQRLGVEEDTDIELMIDNFFELNRELCERIYRSRQNE